MMYVFVSAVWGGEKVEILNAHTKLFASVRCIHFIYFAYSVDNLSPWNWHWIQSFQLDFIKTQRCDCTQPTNFVQRWRRNATATCRLVLRKNSRPLKCDLFMGFSLKYWDKFCERKTAITWTWEVVNVPTLSHWFTRAHSSANNHCCQHFQCAQILCVFFWSFTMKWSRCRCDIAILFPKIKIPNQMQKWAAAPNVDHFIAHCTPSTPHAPAAVRSFFFISVCGNANIFSLVAFRGDNNSHSNKSAAAKVERTNEHTHKLLSKYEDELYRQSFIHSHPGRFCLIAHQWRTAAAAAAALAIKECVMNFLILMSILSI